MIHDHFDTPAETLIPRTNSESIRNMEIGLEILRNNPTAWCSDCKITYTPPAKPEGDTEADATVET